MEPRIQYAKTSDGVNIAYAVFGEGPPIVYPAGVFGDVHMLSLGMLPQAIQFTDALVRLGWRLIRYDGRGSGSSDRDNTDFSLEGRLRDLEAVIERTHFGRFVLSGIVQGGPTAIAYAVRNPDRVSRLVLINTYANAAQYYESVPAIRAARAANSMMEENWEFYTLALANAALGFTDSDLANRYAAAMRSGMSAGALRMYTDANEGIDVTDLLPLVNVPTLVVQQTWIKTSSVDLLRALATRIPNARLVRLEAPDQVLPVIDAFLREGEEQAAAAAELPSGMNAILFADIVESTALTERLGDLAFRARARDLDGQLRTVILDHGGTPIQGKLLGDGILAVFQSAREAIAAALVCGGAGGSAGLPLHLGLHAGDLIREEGNVYGGAVNIASRISGLSAAGEVLVSETVRSLARTSAGVTFEDRGEQALKGVGEAVRVWSVREGV